MNFLQGVLDNPQQRQDYESFVQRYEQGHPSEGYSDQEALNRYQQIAPQLPPNAYQQAAVDALNRLSPQERMQLGQYLMQQAQQQGMNLPGFSQGANFQDSNAMAQHMAQLQQQQPDVLQNLFGKGGALGNPLAKAAVAGIAAMAAKHFLSQQ